MVIGSRFEMSNSRASDLGADVAEGIVRKYGVGDRTAAVGNCRVLGESFSGVAPGVNIGQR